MERLQKIIARSGIASRRFADEMIKNGRVSVNDRIITVPGTKADAGTDKIRVDGKLISVDKSNVYVILNKPRGYISTLSDPEGRSVVTDLLGDINERIFPVGRLDYDSEGLLLMTNDGEFSHRMQHPKFKIPKTYRVKIKGNITDKDIAVFKKGCVLDDGYFRPSNVVVEKSNKKSCWIRVTIFQGRNRIIRRFFNSMGKTVVRLIRIRIGGIELSDLRNGHYRYINKREVERLLNMADL